MLKTFFSSIYRFAVSMSYYGISFSIPDLSGDRYFNFMIGGGIEMAAYILAFVVIHSFGRKFPLMIYLQLSGVLCVSVVCIRHFMPRKSNYLIKKLPYRKLPKALIEHFQQRRPSVLQDASTIIECCQLWQFHNRLQYGVGKWNKL